MIQTPTHTTSLMGSGPCQTPFILGSPPLGSWCSTTLPFILLFTRAWSIPTPGPLHTHCLACYPRNSSHGWSCQSSGSSSHVASAYSCLFLWLPSFLLTSPISSQLKTWAGVLTLPLPYGVTLGEAPNLTVLSSPPVTGL